MNNRQSAPISTDGDRIAPFHPRESRARFEGMTTKRALWETIVYSAIRISPVLAPAAIIPVVPSDPDLVELLLKRALALLAVVITWNMTEGAMILWIKARADASERARGFQISTIICAFLVLFVLQYIRALSTQGIFLFLLTAISVRGMSRSAWENGRPMAGLLGAIGGNALLTLVSLLFVAPGLDWQCGVVALGIGSSVGAVEATWHSTAFAGRTPTPWAPPLYRIAVCAGPVSIATLGALRQLPALYTLTYGVVLVAARLFRDPSCQGKIPSRLLTGSAGIYLGFLGIMAVVRFFESGRLG